MLECNQAPYERRVYDPSPATCEQRCVEPMYLLAAQCLAPGFQHCRDGLHIEDTTTPGAAADVLQSRPQPGVRRQRRVGRQVRMRVAQREDFSASLGRTSAIAFPDQ